MKNFIDIKDLKIKIDNLDVVDNSIVIYGNVSNLFQYNKFYFLDDCNNEYPVEYLDSNIKNNTFFHICIDMNNSKYLVPCLEINNKVYVVKIEFGINSKLNSTFSSLYLSGDNHIVKYNKIDNRFDIYDNNIINVIKFELKCIYFLIKKRKFRNLFIRQLINIFSFFKSRHIWLISDDSNFANDNGEEFFKYVINERLSPDFKYFFAIDKKSCDYKRLHYNYSNVININSFKYKLLFLMADQVISSHFDNININPFGDDKNYLSDLYRHKFIFLQHRNITNDLVYNSLNMDMIITNNKDEYEYFSNNMLKKDIVRLTGFPRNDIDRTKSLNQILILFDEREKEIYPFFNRLINDEKILSILKDKDYCIRLLCDDKYDFDKNDYVSICDKDIIYNDEFKDSKLLITNNIDLAYDFFYLKRSVIYYSFLKEDVDVFGSSCFKYDSLVKEIIKLIKRDCILDKKYIKKIDKLYEFNDNGNCIRVYDEIIK